MCYLNSVYFTIVLHLVFVNLFGAQSGLGPR